MSNIFIGLYDVYKWRTYIFYLGYHVENGVLKKKKKMIRTDKGPLGGPDKKYKKQFLVTRRA